MTPSTFAERLFDRHRTPADALGAALFALFGTVVDMGNITNVPGSHSWWAAVLAVPLVWRRTHPLASAVALYLLALLQVLTGPPLVLPADVAVLISLYSLTAHGPRWATGIGITATMFGSLVLGIQIYLDPYRAALDAISATVLAGILALTVWAFGLLRRNRLATVGELRERARRLEIERDQQILLATTAERSRIAREMHDIVAHSLSVIVAQADGGRYASTADPAAAERSLTTIAETGRAALADMRRLLGVLRDDPGQTGPGTRAPGTLPAAARSARSGTAAAPPELTPQPASGDIEQLVDQVRATGLRISLVRMGEPRPLPPGLGLTAYRICQESLTNILKHAGPDPSVTVVVTWAPTALVLEVNDDGRGAAADDAPPTGGHGLLGMRERAAMFGGDVVSGPRPGGGFRVRATLPLPTSS